MNDSTDTTARDTLAEAVQAYHRSVKASAGYSWHNETRAARAAAVNMMAVYLVATGEYANQVQAVRAITAEIKADQADEVDAPAVFHCDEYADAIDRGAEIVAEAIGAEPEGLEHDVIDLVTNAARDCLENPDTTFDDMVTNHYSRTPAEVRAWWNNWT